MALPPAPGTPPGTPVSVEVTNQSDGEFCYWLFKLYLFGLMGLVALALLSLVGTYVYFASTLPALPDLATYHETAKTTTMTRAWDGTPLGELAAERREILPFEKFPAPLVNAFLAAEDR